MSACTCGRLRFFLHPPGCSLGCRKMHRNRRKCLLLKTGVNISYSIGVIVLYKQCTSLVHIWPFPTSNTLPHWVSQAITAVFTATDDRRSGWVKYGVKIQAGLYVRRRDEWWDDYAQSPSHYVAQTISWLEQVLSTTPLQIQLDFLCSFIGKLKTQYLLRLLSVSLSHGKIYEKNLGPNIVPYTCMQRPSGKIRSLLRK